MNKAAFRGLGSQRRPAQDPCQAAAIQDDGKFGLEQFIGKSPAFLAEFNKIPATARCLATVLILGETGTGKEMCARAIHSRSSRSKHPFIPVNCGAFPSDLIENELFGHAAGAFTSATHASRGLVQAANRGTLFLDEIDALPLPAQVKLLRFLQDKEFRPVGASNPGTADVRIIVASNTDLHEEMRMKRFRPDLYYRVNVIVFNLPKLRERAEDIPLLIHHFIDEFTTKAGKAAKMLTPAALKKLLHYQWPGNVRELQKVIERAVVMSGQELLDENDMVLSESVASSSSSTFQALKAFAIAEFEQQFLKQLLSANEGNVSKAAKSGGMHRKSLQRLIRKWQPLRSAGLRPGTVVQGVKP